VPTEGVVRCQLVGVDLAVTQQRDEDQELVEEGKPGTQEYKNG